MENEKKVIVAEHGTSLNFEVHVNDLISSGYKILSSNCAFDQDGALYQAILIKEESSTKCKLKRLPDLG